MVVIIRREREGSSAGRGRPPTDENKKTTRGQTSENNENDEDKKRRGVKTDERPFYLISHFTFGISRAWQIDFGQNLFWKIFYVCNIDFVKSEVSG